MAYQRVKGGQSDQGGIIANIHMCIILVTASVKLKGASLSEIIDFQEKKLSGAFDKNSAKLTTKVARNYLFSDIRSFTIIRRKIAKNSQIGVIVMDQDKH